MAQQGRTSLRDDPLGNTLDHANFNAEELDEQGVRPGMAPVPMQEGRLVTGMFGDQITAQRVAVPRDINKIKARMKAFASAAGSRYVYSWEVKGKDGRKTIVEGGTIVLANDLAREYGNCSVEARVRDEGQQWVFYARFADLETGFTLVRAFQQRKQQNTGMADAGRALDIIFQIGQSKAIRNVVLDALQTLGDYCIEEAKGALVKRVGENPEGARKSIIDKIASLGLTKGRVEAVYGRSADKWTVPDMAKIYTELQSIADGMMNADDVFPVSEDDGRDKQQPQPEKKKAAAPQSPAQPPADDARTEGAQKATAGAGAPSSTPAAGNGTPETGPTARAVVLEGGEQIAAYAGDVDIDMPLDLQGLGLYRVTEFSASQIVVQKVAVKGAPAAAPSQPAKRRATPKFE